MLARFWLLLVLAILLPGCGNMGKSVYDAMIQKLVAKDDDDQARLFVEAVRKNDFDAAKTLLSPKVPKDNLDQGLRDLHMTLDQGEPVEMKLIGFRSNTFVSLKESTSRENLTYQIQFRDVWVVGDVLLDKDEIATFVLGAHFQRIPNSLDVLNQFNLVKWTPAHYVVLAFTVIIPVFILTALVVCIRTKVRRKWLWIIFILLGVGAVHFDWTTGAFSYQIFHLNLFGVGVMATSPYSPWIFELGFPLGAVIFLLRRRSLALPKPPPPGSQ
jgi:hypothetical protein